MCRFVPAAAHSSEIETAVASDKIVLGKISLEDFYQSTLLTPHSRRSCLGCRPLTGVSWVSDVMMRLCYHGWTLIILLQLFIGRNSY